MIRLGLTQRQTPEEHPPDRIRVLDKHTGKAVAIDRPRDIRGIIIPQHKFTTLAEETLIRLTEGQHSILPVQMLKNHKYKELSEETECLQIIHDTRDHTHSEIVIKEDPMGVFSPHTTLPMMG